MDTLWSPSSKTSSRNAVECECNESERECAGNLMRKYRERERGEDEQDSKTEDELNVYNQYMDGLDDTERAISGRTTKIHDVLSHCDFEDEAVGLNLVETSVDDMVAVSVVSPPLPCGCADCRCTFIDERACNPAPTAPEALCTVHRRMRIMYTARCRI